MRIKSLLALTFIAVSVSSCSLYNKLVYRIDVPQGNYLQQDQVDQLQVGMTPQQVQYLLGTPLLIDPYNRYVWYYVFLQQKGHQEPVQRTLTVTFSQQGNVSDFTLDKPLPEVQKGDVKPIELDDEHSWWQSFKNIFSSN
ncbi:outer membrane protein assembly factor BamE [Pasteurellaceae bacterium HPA106]|uniref:outer membrane protein assembly factor BamE n=1 Tax=Spirabiliibacterium pneumoniae TaxID=221400 RepID=UPI001AADB216|nr:outer membrane protein assembly factor BamE [Spirabiliibacterium pneumoniae]MBE2895387.1 outer membrane protein assembly factor BamE [Spirabiliibacterium pneumoniae]